MRAYVVMITPEASLGKVSQEAYTTLRAAQEFIESRLGKPSKKTDYFYLDACFTRYEICEVIIK